MVGGASSCELGVPHYVGDNYCDDENNNALCGFDGGDCCQGDAAKDGWDRYCNECQCLMQLPWNWLIWSARFNKDA